MTTRSSLELIFAEQLRQDRIEFSEEVIWHSTRKWRFDFVIPKGDGYAPSEGLAVEIEGGSFVSGRHTRGDGFEKDAEKYAEALCNGWRVLRVTGDMVHDGRALDYVRRLLS